MKPTDSDLNAAMAEACGWIWVAFDVDFDPHTRARRLMREVPTAYIWPSPAIATGDEEIDMPDAWLPQYCTDRNTLPEVWKEIGNCMVIPDFMRFMDFQEEDAWRAWDVMISSPRLHVEAALRALDKWKPEWKDE